MSDKLDPREKALQMEGEALLHAANPDAAASGQLVDSTGAPLGKEDEKTNITMSPELARLQYQRAVEARLQEHAKQLSEIFKGDESAANVRDVMFLCYQILFWARMEMAGNGDVTDQMIDDLEQILQRSIYNDSKGYNLNTVIQRMQNRGLPIMKDFVRHYTSEGKLRKMRLDKVKKVLGEGKGYPLPPSVEKVLGKPFMPGQALIIRGDAKATSQAIVKIMSGMDDKLKRGKVSWLSKRAELPEEGLDGHIHHRWWKNGAQTLNKLDEVLEPVVNSEAMILLVEDIDHLFCDSNEIADQMTRKMFALKRLYQWAVNNTVAVIACDNMPPPPEVEKPYGFIPFVDALLDVSSLKIGEDVFPIEEKKE